MVGRPILLIILAIVTELICFPLFRSTQVNSGQLTSLIFKVTSLGHSHHVIITSSSLSVTLWFSHLFPFHPSTNSLFIPSPLSIHLLLLPIPSSTYFSHRPFIHPLTHPSCHPRISHTILSSIKSAFIHVLTSP